MRTRELFELRASDRGTAGGKAAHLGEISHCDPSIPPGFVITTRAFEEALRQSNLITFIEEELARADDSDEQALEEISEVLMRAVSELPLEEELEQEVFARFDALEASLVAVRSSSPEEDSAKSSWAGQFDTVLGVRRDNLLEAIKQCWCSFFSLRALSYRAYREREQGAQSSPPGMAVIVQVMIPAELSGVTFSVDPVSGRSDRLAIECVRGLGEALVSGELTPTRYLVEKSTLRVVERAEREQLVGLSLSPGGGAVWKTLQCPGRVSLPHALIKELSSRTLLLEAKLGYPVDIEWAVADDMLYVLQARPITTLGGPPVLDADSRHSGRYDFYWSENRVVFSAESEFYTFLSHRHLPANECSRGFCFVQEGYATAYFFRGDLPAAEKEAESVLCDPRRFQEYLATSAQARTDFENLHDELRTIDVRPLSNHALLAFFFRFEEVHNRIRALYRISQPAYTDFVAERLKQALYRCGVAESEIEQAFIKVTAVTELDIVQEEELAAIYSSLKRNIFREDVREHRRKFPWLFLNTFDSFLADQFLVEKFEALKAMPAAERRDRAARIIEESRETQIEKAELLDRFRDEEVSYLGNMLAELALDRFRLKAWWGGIELLFLPLFQEIAERAELHVEEFLHSYRSEDIHRLLRDGDTVPVDIREARKSAYALYLKDNECFWFEGPPALAIYKELIEQFERSNELETEVRGTVANIGAARGRARIIRVEGLKTLLRDREQFQAGEILVTSMTQPTMVLLARKAAAIVTNEGGVTSHASVIARELGIPCVVGTKIATQMISDGDYIEVDAYRGIVRKLAND